MLRLSIRVSIRGGKKKFAKCVFLLSSRAPAFWQSIDPQSNPRQKLTRKFAFCELFVPDSTCLLNPMFPVLCAERPRLEIVIFAKENLKSCHYADHQSGYGGSYRGGPGGYGGEYSREIQAFEGGAAEVGGARGGGEGWVYCAVP